MKDLSRKFKRFTSIETHTLWRCIDLVNLKIILFCASDGCTCSDKGE